VTSQDIDCPDWPRPCRCGDTYGAEHSTSTTRNPVAPAEPVTVESIKESVAHVRRIIAETDPIDRIYLTPEREAEVRATCGTLVVSEETWSALESIRSYWSLGVETRIDHVSGYSYALHRSGKVTPL